MGIGYTINGDTLQNLGWDYYAGQTFSPTESFTLYFIDINLRTTQKGRAPDVKLYLADATHFPTGNPLSEIRQAYAANWNYYNVFRMRADMSPVDLVAGTEYVIVIHAFAAYQAFSLRWQYDNGDATFSAGMRIVSTDGGSSWAERPNDDHIFYAFGEPPGLKPPPDPPVENWALLNIVWNITETGMAIITTTSVPCHMYLFYTLTEPEKHKEAILRRGIYLKDALRYCFIGWTSIEQEEEGDTEIHTFIVEPWPYCQTRWLTFRAQVNGEWSPSATAIFHYHRVAPPPVYTIDLVVQQGSDDCARRLTTSFWSLTHGAVVAGSYSLSLYQWGSGMRFQNVAIPPGSTIIEAHLTYMPTADTTNNPKTSISAEKVANPPTFADDSGIFDARRANNTAAYVNWDNLVWFTLVPVDSPDIKSIIQEVIDQPTWADGNSIVIFWDDFADRSNHALRNWGRAQSYEYPGVAPPELHITYSPP